MNETLNLIMVLVMGSALGVLFFGGLWLTVKKSVTSGKPALLILVSFLFRMAFVLIGFYLVAAGNWQRLLMALLGFVIARFAVIHFTKTIKSTVGKEINRET